MERGALRPRVSSADGTAVDDRQSYDVRTPAGRAARRGFSRDLRTGSVAGQNACWVRYLESASRNTLLARAKAPRRRSSVGLLPTNFCVTRRSPLSDE